MGMMVVITSGIMEAAKEVSSKMIHEASSEVYMVTLSRTAQVVASLDAQTEEWFVISS